MPCCSIVICKARSQAVCASREGVSFHRYPKDPELKNKWINATGRKNWFPTKTSTICSSHFHSTDFIETKSAKRFLSKFAFPTIDIWKYSKDESSDSSPSSPDSQNADSQVQPPIVKRLIKQRTRLLAALKLEKMKVKKFREQNRRKSKKIASLHNIIFNMKNKMMNKGEETEEKSGEVEGDIANDSS